ncbi:MAG: mechanosensitive ion channel domain-containing protein [Akkermansiaceae bacterium]
MRLLFIGLFYTLCLQLSYGQALIEESKIIQEISSFTESESSQKEAWQQLLQLRKDFDSLENEISELEKSNKTLAAPEGNLQKASDLSQISEEIAAPTLAQITKRFNEVKQLKENVTAQQETIEKSLASSSARLKLIPNEITTTQTDLATLQATPEPTTEISKSTRALLIAKHEKSLEKLDLEQSQLEKYIPILQSNLKTLTKDQTKIDKIYAIWDDKLIEVNKNTAASIKASVITLSLKLSDGSPAKELAEQTIALSESLLSEESIQAKLKSTRKELATLKQSFQLIDEQQKYARERINLLDKADLSVDRETGTLLRKQRSELPSEKALKFRLTTVFQASTKNELELLQERDHLDAIVEFTSDAYEENFTSAQRAELTKEEFTSLTKSSLQLHKIVIKERNELSTEYRELISLLEKTSKSSKTYSDYIDSRLLWIVSHPPLSKQSFIDEAQSLNTLYGTSALSRFFTSLKSDALNYPVLWILFTLSFIIILATQQKFYQWAKAANKEAARGSCNTFRPTLIALFSSIVIILPIPLILAFIGWRLPSDQPLQAGLLLGSTVAAIISLIRRLSKKGGFFESNDMVNTGHLKLCRKALCPLYFILPIVIITATALTRLNTEITQGRLFNMLILIIMAAAMHYILLPKKRLLNSKKKPGFLSYLVYFTFVIIPLILVFAAAVGYFISMLTLKTQLIYTLRITLGILFISALLRRWLLVTRRRALMSAHQTAIADPESPLTEQEKKQEIQETVTKISEQSSKLIHVVATVILVFSLITVWSKTLPALSVLDNVNLWETSSSETTNKAESSNINPLSSLTGTSEPAASESTTTTKHITLQDLLVTIIVSFLTYLAAVNIPSLLQITILNHLKLKHGTAFTFTTAIRYVIITIGIIWAFGSIGVTWDKIQWLAAAITLGIGFGLQEIFANFVAGLILLFERPIRIGDLITVGNINGKVSKIQMRATTILQFNNRELIVPNKEFITGQLVNWTLSDNVIRVEIAVGIAYGSDTVRAKEILLECAENNNRILQTPKPDVIFSAFGASSLDFILRAFISSVDDLAPGQSELHYAIDNAYREAGIEIAFPQQDIHIRSIDAAFPTEKHNNTTKPSSTTD